MLTIQLQKKGFFKTAFLSISVFKFVPIITSLYGPKPKNKRLVERGEHILIDLNDISFSSFCEVSTVYRCLTVLVWPLSLIGMLCGRH